MAYTLHNAVDLLLETDGVNKAEHDITLDIRIATGENADSCSRDYTDILAFLRTLVSNGNVASVGQVLQTLQTFQRARGSQNSAAEPLASSVNVGSDTATKRGCDSTDSHGQVLITAKVGGRDSHQVGPASQNARRIRSLPALLQGYQSHSRKQFITYAPPDIQELVNMECGGEHVFRSTLLHCAIFTGNEEMVRCLLKWGADATLALECVGQPQYVSFQYSDNWVPEKIKYRPMGVAVILKHAGIVQCLVTHGVSPYQSSILQGEDLQSTCRSTYSACRGDAATSEALCLNPKYPPPIIEICRVQQDGHGECAQRMMPYCRWDAACCQSDIAPLLQKVSIPLRTSLLDMPCFTDAERVCKQFCCALILRSSCGNSECAKSIRGGMVMDGAMLTGILQNLLQEGAEPAGLSRADVEALWHAWIPVENAEAEVRGTVPVTFQSRVGNLGFHSHGHLPRPLIDILSVFVNGAPLQPFASGCISARSAIAYCSIATPPAVERLLMTRSTEDPVVQLLVKHGGLPGISTVDEIPFVDGHLHDGPSCQCHVELSSAQRNVSLSDVLMPHPKPKSLVRLCRSAIIEACHGYGVVKAIQSL